MPRFVYGLLALCFVYLLWTQWLKPLPNLADMPNSQPAANGVQVIDGYQIHDLETYAGEFRILGRQAYSSGREAEFSPVDFAVGWGDMAKPEVYSQIDIQQSNRWYYWQVDEFPIPKREIETHSANMHIIPANASVAAALKDIKPGDLVYLQGALVEIRAQDGWRWRSSLSREDTGSGACEVMRVDQVIKRAA